MQMFAGSKTKRWTKKIPKRMSSAAIILEDGKGRALIVKANYKAYWTFPGGIVDPGETPKEAAIRETLEEVGVRVNPDKMEFVAVIDRKSDITQTYQFIFKTRLEPEMLEAITLQASEIDEYALVTKSDVLKKDRVYGKVIDHWARNRTGYLEQLFEGGKDA